MHISSGGDVTFVSLPGNEAARDFDKMLCDLNLTGLTLAGDAPLWLGTPRRHQIDVAVKKALDPAERFPGWEE